jgi:hypothetical protein
MRRKGVANLRSDADRVGLCRKALPGLRNVPPFRSRNLIESSFSKKTNNKKNDSARRRPSGSWASAIRSGTRSPRSELRFLAMRIIFALVSVNISKSRRALTPTMGHTRRPEARRFLPKCLLSFLLFEEVFSCLALLKHISQTPQSWFGWRETFADDRRRHWKRPIVMRQR